MKIKKIYSFSFLLFFLLFVQLACTKEKVVAVRHIKVFVPSKEPVIFTNPYQSNGEFILNDYNPGSKYYKQSVLRTICVKDYTLYSGDCATRTECDGCRSLFLNNNTDSDMNVTYQLGGKKETVFIKAKSAITRYDFPDFCAQPDLRIISYDYL